jgi:hypothetical protein
MARLWALVSELRGGQVLAQGQLIRLTGFLPADLAARLLRLLDGGPELVGAQGARIRTAIDPNDSATPALAVIVLGWLEAAEQVLAAGSSPRSCRCCWAWPTATASHPSATARQQRLGDGRPRNGRRLPLYPA